MFSHMHAAFGVAAQFLAALTVAASAQDATIPASLTLELQAWIDTNTDLPPADAPATIVIADAKEVAEPSEIASMIGSRPRGFYESDTRTITLIKPWNAEKPKDVAVLLHEFVHHRQDGKHYYCEAAKEHAAYKLQKTWLAERDLSLDVNWIAIIIASSCSPRDFHP